jgi:hypothetical protein
MNKLIIYLIIGFILSIFLAFKNLQVNSDYKLRYHVIAFIWNILFWPYFVFLMLRYKITGK